MAVRFFYVALRVRVLNGADGLWRRSTQTWQWLWKSSQSRATKDAIAASDWATLSENKKACGRVERNWHISIMLMLRLLDLLYWIQVRFNSYLFLQHNLLIGLKIVQFCSQPRENVTDRRRNRTYSQKQQNLVEFRLVILYC